LILPTYHVGEGYPGIIIEAFSIGMPVISTYWNSIPELISHNKNGLLVPIKDLDSLVNSISFYNQKNYKQFSKSALSSFNKFNSEKVNLNFVKKINITNVK
jgi:glycosyltransferase involved in cell wall biosynthesis